MTIQLASPVLRMTKPTVTVPLPRHVSSSALDAALFELENEVVHPGANASFRSNNMTLELVQSISDYLKMFDHPYDHKAFIAITNETGLTDASYYKVRNLMALTPSNAASSGGVEITFQIMNGLSAWGIRTDDAIVSGYRAVQAEALMSVASTVNQLDNGDENLIAYYTGISRARLLSDPELVDLVKDYPEHHKLISETIQARQGADVELLRDMLSSGALVINDGRL